ncbi:MAG: FtsX-like permease family protein [Gemmatimonadota bacterium]
MRLLTRSSVRYWVGHRLQTGLSILGVALGVAVVLSIDMAIDASKEGFRLSAETVAGRATHTLTRSAGDIPDHWAGTVRRDLGVRLSAPVVEGFARSERVPGRTLRILGVDPLSEAPFRPWLAGGANDRDVGAFLTEPLGVFVSSVLADGAGLREGDELPIDVAGRSWTLRISGVLEPADDVARSGLADVLLMDIAGAQDVLAMVGVLSRIDLRLDEGEELDLGPAISAGLLPADAALEPVGTRSETLSGMIAAFDVNLTALSLLALVFGMFLIYNAVTFSVVQRRTLLGRLRAIGVTREEVVRLILSEAVWVGALGALLGVLLGIVLSRGLVGMVSRTINDLYFAVSVRGVSLDPFLVAKAALLGLGATVLAAVPPALEASGSNPRLAAMRSVVESRARRLVPRVALIGALGAGLGGLVLLVPTRSLVVSFTALFLIITGLALVTPAGTLLVVAAVRPTLSRLLGVPGAMAARGVASSLSRTAPAIAALVVAVSVTVGLGVMIDSFRGSLSQWLDGTLQADIYVSLPGVTASRAAGTLWPSIVDDFVSHPDVSGHSTYRGSQVVRDGDVYNLVALELDPRGEAAFQFLPGAAPAPMRRFRDGTGLIVSEPFAYRRDLVVGDMVPIVGTEGVADVPIAGIFQDYGSEQGTVMMGRALYDRLFADEGITSLGLFLDDGADSEAVVSALLRAVPEDRSVIVRTNDTLRRASLDVFDRTFRVTAVLRLLAFIVAFVGVLGALAALQLERARELGLLRATGMTPGQVWRVVVGQTGLMGLAAGVLSIPMGLALSWVMIYVVNKRSFGWTLDMRVGPDILVQAVVLAVVAALLAGLWPARAMSKTRPAVALRGE